MKFTKVNAVKFLKNCIEKYLVQLLSHSHKYSGIVRPAGLGRARRGSLAFCNLLALTNTACHKQWTLLSLHFGVTSNIQIRQYTVSFACTSKVLDPSSWRNSVSQGCPSITEKTVAAQSGWRTSPLKYAH